jgi:hypothetical protein
LLATGSMSRTAAMPASIAFCVPPVSWMVSERKVSLSAIL